MVIKNSFLAIPGEWLRVAFGANQGDGIGTISEIEPEDVYRLTQKNQPLLLELETKAIGDHVYDLPVENLRPRFAESWASPHELLVFLDLIMRGIKRQRFPLDRLSCEGDTLRISLLNAFCNTPKTISTMANL